MKIKLERILNSNNALGELLDTDLPIVTSMKLKPLVRRIKTLYEDFDEAKKEVFKKHEIKEEEDVDLKKRAEKIQKELDDLVNSEVSIDFDVIPVEHLGNISIKPRVLMALDWLIKW